MASDDDNSTASAAKRLSQVSNHISGNQSEKHKKRSLRKKKEEDDLPADYSDILGQLDSLRQMAATPDLANRGYVRQKEAGKLWVRERIDQLFDPGSFREVGSASGTVEWKKTGHITEEPV